MPCDCVTLLFCLLSIFYSLLRSSIPCYFFLSILFFSIPCLALSSLLFEPPTLFHRTSIAISSSFFCSFFFVLRNLFSWICYCSSIHPSHCFPIAFPLLSHVIVVVVVVFVFFLIRIDNCNTCLFSGFFAVLLLSAFFLIPFPSPSFPFLLPFSFIAFSLFLFSYLLPCNPP